LKLTEKERKICKQYSARDEKNKVHCSECPLALHEFFGDYGRCKATLTKKEWKENMR
jgi:hypothetical protein